MHVHLGIRTDNEQGIIVKLDRLTASRAFTDTTGHSFLCIS